MAGKLGLFQKSDGGVWLVRKVIPAPLRPRFGKHSFVQSTGETDRRKAEEVAKRLLKLWTAEIKARSATTAPVATVEQAEAAIAAWRVLECDRASGADLIDAQRRQAEALVREVLTAHRQASGEVLLGPMHVSIGPPNSTPFPSMSDDAVSWAEGYFAVHSDASRGLGLPHGTGLLLAAYERAAEDPNAFAAVEDFDSRLDAAVKIGGLATPMTPLVREKVRQAFAGAALAVERYREAERRRAAAILAAVNANPGDVRAEVGYQPRPGDVTLGAALKTYKAERAARLGEEDTEKDIGHIARALEELVGAEKPIRSITREECTQVRDLLKRMPANASKIYPGLALVEAADRAARDRAAFLERAGAEGVEIDVRDVRPKLMAPGTVASYVNSLSAFFNWSVERGLVDSNPARGLGGRGRNSKQVQRRAFTKEELQIVFAGLQEERTAGAAKFWVPAILVFSGCRLNEICQLHTADVKELDGIPYFDLTPFDETGRRVEEKRLKTAASQRCVPVHPELVAAGFLNLVAQRRRDGAKRLFPELKERRGYYSDDLSKWWGRWCDRCRLTDPALTLHSHRHAFRDAGREARVPTEIIDAIGGWTTESVGANYGDRVSVAKLRENLEHLKHMSLGAGFTLGKPPAVSPSR